MTEKFSQMEKFKILPFFTVRTLVTESRNEREPLVDTLKFLMITDRE